MGFQSVRLYGFRNLQNGKISLDSDQIFLIGENAQGKTSFLEALYLLSYGSSFRTRQDRDLITWGEQEMGVTGTFQLSDEPHGNLGVTLKNGQKTIRYCGKTVEDRKFLLKRVPSIVFVHDDFQFSSGPPEKRRWFMDQTLSLYDPLFVDLLRRYKKLLKERNCILRSGKFEVLDHYSQQLVKTGLMIMQHRRQLTEEFGKIFTDLYAKISLLPVSVELLYKSSWANLESEEMVLEKLKEKRSVDISLGMTSTGPHRDQFVFMSEGRNFSNTASTGQKRLISLVLRASQAKYFSKMTSIKPLLLLDDVLLELDPQRRMLFRENLPEAEQVIYTFLPGEEIGNKNNNSQTYEVRAGSFYER